MSYYHSVHTYNAATNQFGYKTELNIEKLHGSTSTIPIGMQATTDKTINSIKNLLLAGIGFFFIGMGCYQEKHKDPNDNSANTFPIVFFTLGGTATVASLVFCYCICKPESKKTITIDQV